jgi:hypothetical protein
MKYKFTFVNIAFIMLFSLSTLSAQNLTQNQDRPEVVANNELQILTNDLGLNSNQKRTLFRALVTREVSIRKSNLDENKATMVNDQKKANDAFNSQMIKTLTPEQYEAWKNELKN